MRLLDGTRGGEFAADGLENLSIASNVLAGLPVLGRGHTCTAAGWK